MQYLLLIDLIIATLLIVIVMLQSKGTGLSIVGGTSDFGKFERRGPEKTLHVITIGLVAIFILVSMIIYFIS